jgi:D-3-phosphoglycerate dehydrogenase
MIPIHVCKSLGIPVTNLPGSNARAVGELVLALALGVLRRVVELDRRLRRGEVLPNIDWMAETLDDKTIGLVGMGNIAREAAKKFVVRSSP